MGTAFRKNRYHPRGLDVRKASPPASRLEMGILPPTHALPPGPLSCCLGFQHPKLKAPAALRSLLLSGASQCSGSTFAAHCLHIRVHRHTYYIEGRTYNCTESVIFHFPVFGKQCMSVLLMSLHYLGLMYSSLEHYHIKDG